MGEEGGVCVCVTATRVDPVTREASVTRVAPVNRVCVCVGGVGEWEKGGGEHTACFGFGSTPQ